jgi:hypothetical protein
MEEVRQVTFALMDFENIPRLDITTFQDYVDSFFEMDSMLIHNKNSVEKIIQYNPDLQTFLDEDGILCSLNEIFCNKNDESHYYGYRSDGVEKLEDGCYHIHFIDGVYY